MKILSLLRLGMKKGVKYLKKRRLKYVKPKIYTIKLGKSGIHPSIHRKLLKRSYRVVKSAD